MVRITMNLPVFEVGVGISIELHQNCMNILQYHE